ncbi:MAG TPA: hypothetical protein VF232_06855 [Gaiellaceae bacterium]
MALEALLGSGAGDDALAVAPPELGAELSLLLPQLLETLLEAMYLRLKLCIVAVG